MPAQRPGASLVNMSPTGNFVAACAVDTPAAAAAPVNINEPFRNPLLPLMIVLLSMLV